MNYMFTQLRYTKAQVEAIFQDEELNATTLPMLLDSLGLEQFHPSGMERLAECLPKWQSALNYTCMRLGIEE